MREVKIVAGTERLSVLIRSTVNIAGSMNDKALSYSLMTSTLARERFECTAAYKNHLAELPRSRITTRRMKEVSGETGCGPFVRVRVIHLSLGKNELRDFRRRASVMIAM